MRAALYLRISTEDEEDAKSLDTHQQRLTRWVEREGWEITTVYREQASARLGSSRPELERAVSDGEAGGFDALLVNDPARFGRGADSAALWVRLYRAGVEVRAYNPNRAPLSEVDFLSALAYAAEERQNITRRMRDGRQARADDGLWPGGPAPFGTALVDGSLVADPSQAQTVRDIAEAVLAGEPVAAIAAELNERGVPTIKGAPWIAARLRRLLRQDRLSSGVMTYWGADLEHPVLIDPDTHRQVLRYLDAGRARYGAKRAQRVYPLSGRLVDPEGHTWTGFVLRDRRHYRCSEVRRNGAEACDWRTARVIRAEEVEDAVWEQLMWVLSSVGAGPDDQVGDHGPLARVVAEALSSTEAPSEEEITAARRKVRQVEAALADVDAELRLTDDPARLRRQVPRLEARLAAARERLAGLEALAARAADDQEAWQALEEAAASVTALVAETDPAARRAVIEELDIRVRLDDPPASWPVPGADGRPTWQAGAYEQRYMIHLNGRLAEVPWQSL